MKKLFIFLTVGIFLLQFTSFPSFAQEATRDKHTAKEEAEGKELFNKLRIKQTECKDLSDDDFQALGEYYMGQMTGESHEAMNNMMIQMMGEEGEKQMHIVMGKRLSGCDTSAQIPSQGVGFMPMMWMMRGGNPMMGNGNMMDWIMGGAYGFGILSSIISLLIIVVLVLLAVYLWKLIQKK